MGVITVKLALSTAYSAVQIIRKAPGALKDAKAQLAISDLMQALADITARCTELQKENAKLKNTKNIRNKLEKRDLGYYLTKPLKGYGEGPFCQVCMDVDGRLVSMAVRNERGRGQVARCLHCLKASRQ